MLPRYGTTGMKKNNIGIFGGTFDPVHKAHVAVAEKFIKDFSLDRLYIIPNNVPPLKAGNTVLGEDRAKMLEIAFSGMENVVVSRIELNRSGTSYTCDTLAEIKNMHPNDDIYLLMGDDWISSFTKWKSYMYILDNSRLVIAARSSEELNGKIGHLANHKGQLPLLLNNSKIEISSTDFRRERFAEILPEGVYAYIKERGFYGV